jgi:hypothetical protein
MRSVSGPDHAPCPQTALICGHSGVGAARGPSAKAVLSLVDAAEPPLRLLLGTHPYAVAEKAYAEWQETWRRSFLTR